MAKSCCLSGLLVDDWGYGVSEVRVLDLCAIIGAWSDVRTRGVSAQSSLRRLRIGLTHSRTADQWAEPDPPGPTFLNLIVVAGTSRQLVTRDELKKKLWTSNTFVDFEHNLNKAVNRLRDALETARNSRSSSRRFPARVTGGSAQSSRTEMMSLLEKFACSFRSRERVGEQKSQPKIADARHSRRRPHRCRLHKDSSSCLHRVASTR